MSSIRPCAIPQGALLARYTDGGAYADCYCTDVPGTISQAEYVEAFYTTSLFKLERMLLKTFAAKPSTDADARQLALGAATSFAAWRVEGQSADQLLLCDFTGRTRSWLMTAANSDGGAPATRLYFGSAVVPAIDRASGKKSLGFPFQALLGFHKLYSRGLLGAASARLARTRPAGK